MNTTDPAEAQARARQVLANGGWDSDEPEETKPVTRDQYLRDPDVLAKFDQALADGVVVTLQSWDMGAPED